MSGRKMLGDLMRQAQKVQEQLARVQEEAARHTVEATAGGGMVKVVANGKQEIVSIRIDPEVVNPEDVEMLQDLVQAAVNEALRRAREKMAEEVRSLMGGFGLNLPGLF